MKTSILCEKAGKKSRESRRGIFQRISDKLFLMKVSDKNFDEIARKISTSLYIFQTVESLAKPLENLINFKQIIDKVFNEI